jgi:flagellar biosynthesis protein FlhF
MLAALQTVQKELGADAIVLSMRQVSEKPAWAFWEKDACEVIAMPRGAGPLPVPAEKPASANPARVEELRPAEPKKSSQAPVTPILPPALRRVSTSQTRQVYQTKVNLDPEIETRAVPQLSRKELPGALQKIEDRLAAQGVDKDLLFQMMSSCARMVTSLGIHDPESLEGLVRSTMEAQVKGGQRSSIHPPTRVMCLIGPSGGGKTSACAKLAYLYSQKLAKKVVWISADTIRTGAISETRAYTDGLGVKLELAYLPEELERAVTSFPEADLILVDTPRCNPFREDNLVELATFLTRVPGRSNYLVLPATMKDADVRQAQAGFSVFSPRGTVVSKVDETCTLGTVFNLACLSATPVTFLTSGTQFSGGLHPCAADILAGAVLAGRFEA